MSYTKISQLAARALKKRVEELLDEKAMRHSRWYQSNYPGQFLMRVSTDAVSENILRTAQRLAHAVVARLSQDSTEIQFFAVAP